MSEELKPEKQFFDGKWKHYAKVDRETSPLVTLDYSWLQLILMPQEQRNDQR